jgi:Werner syndrome ATP-dependent helicase
MEINSIYKKLYPDRNLKDLQLHIIYNLLNGKDVVAILATGYGKSICYQLPFLFFNKCVIVVSPLIALMEDQKINLENLGIPCICMNSNMTISQKETEKNLIIDCDENKIIYMTPEYLVKSELFIKELVEHNKLCLIAIDEAHCISSWGHDFRKDYQQLCCLKEWTNNQIPIFACTATATPKVQKEIVLYLQLHKPVIVKSSFDRKNLFIECKKKSGNISDDILPVLQDGKYDNVSIIIYAKTRDKTEDICEIVKSLNMSCEAYHAGLTSKKRKEIHSKFVSGECKCIVATIAFGMGIDQNVRLIIHYGLPSDMESYVQEIGRAGRDGLDSKCILFWNDQDIHISRAMLKDISNEQFRKYKDEQLKLMDTWSRTNTCRKKILLKHFGELMDEPCMKCDNCIKNLEEKMEKYNQEPLYFPIFLIIKTMFVAKRNGLGAGRIIDILRGSENKLTAPFINCPTYGKGNKYSHVLLKEIIRLLIFNDYLREVTLPNVKFGSILMTTGKSIQFYNENKNYKLENEMGYIKWDNFNIPESFEIIYKYLPRNNAPAEKAKRKTLLQKTLDMFNLDENGEELKEELEIIKDNNNISTTQLHIQEKAIDELIKKDIKSKTKKQANNDNENSEKLNTKTNVKTSKKSAKIINIDDELSDECNLVSDKKYNNTVKIPKKILKVLDL